LSEPCENVRYWDEEGWKKCFTEDLGSLHRSSIAVKAIGDWLTREVGRPLKEVLRDGPSFKILLGGLREDGTFSENGLAGGRFNDLVEWMRINEAERAASDYVYTRSSSVNRSWTQRRSLRPARGSRLASVCVRLRRSSFSSPSSATFI